MINSLHSSKNVFISLIYDFIRQFSTLIANKLTAKFISRWADRRFIYAIDIKIKLSGVLIDMLHLQSWWPQVVLTVREKLRIDRRLSAW